MNQITKPSFLRWIKSSLVMLVIFGVLAFALLPRVSPPSHVNFVGTATMIKGKSFFEAISYYKEKMHHNPDSLQTLVEGGYLEQGDLDRINKNTEIIYSPENLDDSKPGDAVVLLFTSKAREKTFFVFPTKTPKFIVTIQKNGESYLRKP